jgi:ribosomal protein S18 acetylase RimI-like enzyme
VTATIAGFALESDAWLGELLGRPAFRLARAAKAETRLPDGSFFATAKIAADQVGLVEALEDRGFRVVDTAVSFAAPVQAIARQEAASVREAHMQERSRVAAIARDSFRYSRFHLDPRIPRSLADRIKAAWAENFFAGRRGDAMLVAEADGETAGFLQLLRPPANRLVIDLIAVDARFRGRGLAGAMIARAAAAMGAVEIAVGTQAANTASIRLYEGLGFRQTGSQFVLHRHGSDEPYPP